MQKTDAQSPIELIMKAEEIGPLAALRSLGLVPGKENGMTKHPGRKTGRMMRGCSSPLPLAGEVGARKRAGRGITGMTRASFAPSLTRPRKRERKKKRCLKIESANPRS